MRIGKLLAAIFGGLILLGGAAMTTGGAFALGVTDGDGWITAPTARVETETAAIVGTDISLELGDAIDNRTFVDFGSIPARIEVEGRNGKEVFIGIAPAEDVGGYVDGTAYVRAHVFEDDLDLTTTAGTASIAPPADESFWAASSTDGNLDWDLESGSWSVVVANADGSPGVDVRLTGSARIPFVEAIGIGLLVFGVLAIVGGATMLYLGVRSDPSQPRPQASPPSPTPAPTGPQGPQEPATIG